MPGVIDVVTGTFNRREHLAQMIDSVRYGIPVGIPYRIIVCDGGSTDGTLEFLRQQPDVIVLEHGELRGAIRAFTDAAKLSTADYTILANDDILFTRGSIMRALTYLEATPTCGAVAFCDNRPIPGMNPDDYHKFKVQTQDARRKDGSHFNAIYAQVGMYRRWLGELAGWWGADDPVMSQARTYGGDNYLTSRILEFGYTVDMVQRANVEDRLPMDDLRKKNADYHDHAFYQRYPQGPIVGSSPVTAKAMPERLRILYMPIYEPGSSIQKITKRGLREALAKICLVTEWDYLNDRISSDEIQAFNPHIILSQYHDANWTQLVDELRLLCPQALFINWHGDARGLTDPDYLTMLRKIDLQLVVNAAPLDLYAELGIPADYWQIGYEVAVPIGRKMPEYDLLFLGNAYNDHRRELGAFLRETGFRVGLYGSKWEQADGECLYDFSQGAALYQSSKIAISDTFQDGQTPIRGFVSNRLFQALASGAFVLQEFSPGLDALTGLRGGVHYATWADFGELGDQIDKYLPDDKLRAKIAKAGQKYVLENFSFDRQVEKLFKQILPKLQGGKSDEIKENQGQAQPERNIL